jgi:hypothetical protein
LRFQISLLKYLFTVLKHGLFLINLHMIILNIIFTQKRNQQNQGVYTNAEDTEVACRQNIEI